MAHAPRLNRVIDRLAADKPAFGTVVPSGALNDMAAVTDAGYDFVMVENEHVAMDFPTLRTSLQGLLSRRRIADQGNLQARPTPLVRVSPNSSEVMHNQWVIKQTLDHGAYGIILPRMESVEQAQAAVVASRYVQRAGTADAAPRGDRGWGPTLAARYWGLPPLDYYDVADLWPLDPDGELLLLPIIESPEGVKRLPDILQQVKGIGGIFAGPGDLSIAMGTRGNQQDPELQEAVLSIVRTCQRFGVACMGMAATPEELDRKLEQGFRIFLLSRSVADPALAHGRSLSSE